jgi:hypothetical protein
MIDKIPPCFSFFGAKQRSSGHYPEPQYDTIIESFAGSAGYSHRYYNRNIILIEKDPIIASVWRFLISANRNDILQLPLLKENQSIDNLDIVQEAKWLIGFKINAGGSIIRKRLTAWGKQNKSAQFWNVLGRERLAENVEKIDHWKIIEGDYSCAPAIEATWFIDPPYQKAGMGYRYSSRDIDYEYLSKWCESRKGQTMVCENLGAKWLQFKLLYECSGLCKRSAEVLWYKSDKKENNLSEFLV